MIHRFEIGQKTVTRIIAIAMFVSLSFAGFSQQKTDTLLQVVELHKTANYTKSYELLSQYRKTHKADVNAEWLFGQAAFYLGKTKEMIAVYEANIKANNENYYLKLDYAFKLVEVGQLKKAEGLLKQFLPYDSLNAQIYASLAKIDFWQSNYKSALKNISKALQLLPNTQNYLAQRDEIKRAMSPWIGINAEFNKDNQPLQTISPTIEGGMYFNTLLMLNASVQAQLIDTNGSNISAQMYSIGNKSVFAKQGLTVRLNAGVITFPCKTTKAIGLIGIDKTIFKSLTFTAQAERKPYLSMLGSLDTSITTNTISVSAKWAPSKGFMGQVAYSASIFGDKNVVATKSAWLVTPELNVWKFGFRVGYGYSFTDSKNDMLKPIKSQSELFYQIDTNASIAGHFKPYLTPKEQEVHSVIGVVNYKLNSFVKLTVSGSYGFLASIKTPYLYGYYNANSEVVVVKGFYKEKYTTLDLNARADFSVSKCLSAKIEYHHSSPNYYYTNDLVAVGLKMLLCNGK